MQSTLLHLKVETSYMKLLDELAGPALTRQAVARMLLIAAIEAVESNGGKIHLPPKFTVQDDSPFTATRFNEPKPEKRK